MRKLITMLVLLFSCYSHATLITLSFDKSVYQQGEQVQGQLVVSEFTNTLGGFAGEIAFDSNKLELASWQFADGFDDGLGSYSFADDSIAGRLVLEDYADLYADEIVIKNNQGTSFVLASFIFNTTALGHQTVNLLNGLELISFDNVSIERFAQLNASFSVVAVNEPSFMLLLTVFIMLMFTGYKKSNVLTH